MDLNSLPMEKVYFIVKKISAISVTVKLFLKAPKLRVFGTRSKDARLEILSLVDEWGRGFLLRIYNSIVRLSRQINIKPILKNVAEEDIVTERSEWTGLRERALAPSTDSPTTKLLRSWPRTSPISSCRPTIPGYTSLLNSFSFSLHRLPNNSFHRFLFWYYGPFGSWESEKKNLESCSSLW